MVFQVPPSKKSVKQDKFEFRVTESGKVYALPQTKYLPPRVALQLGNPNTATAAIEEVFDKYAPGAIDECETTEQFNALSEAWQAEGNVTLGESAASAS